MIIIVTPIKESNLAIGRHFNVDEFEFDDLFFVVIEDKTTYYYRKEEISYIKIKE